jgi:hypothetical protein
MTNASAFGGEGNKKSGCLEGSPGSRKADLKKKSAVHGITRAFWRRTQFPRPWPFTAHRFGASKGVFYAAKNVPDNRLRTILTLHPTPKASATLFIFGTRSAPGEGCVFRWHPFLFT